MAETFELLFAESYGERIYGLRRFASFTIRARKNGDIDLAHDADWVYGFKKYGRNAATVEAMIRAAASDLDCGAIIAAPSHTCARNQLQAMFGEVVRRVRDVPPRKYNHDADIQLGDTVELGEINASAALVVDDVCTTGKTLAALCGLIRQRGKRAIALSIGINHKLNPAPSGIMCEFVPPPTAATITFPPLTPEEIDSFVCPDLQTLIEAIDDIK